MDQIKQNQIFWLLIYTDTIHNDWIGSIRYQTLGNPLPDLIFSCWPHYSASCVSCCQCLPIWLKKPCSGGDVCHSVLVVVCVTTIWWWYVSLLPRNEDLKRLTDEMVWIIIINGPDLLGISDLCVTQYC